MSSLSPTIVYGHAESSRKDSTYGLVEKVVLPQEKEKRILYALL